MILERRRNAKVRDLVLVITDQWRMSMIIMVAVMGVYSLLGAVCGGVIIPDQRSREMRRPRGHDREQQCTHNND